MRRWRGLSKEEQKRYAALARTHSLQAKALSQGMKEQQSETMKVRGGFWGMSASSGFAMSKECVAPHLPSMKTLASEFAEQSRSIRPESPDSFDGAPANDIPLWATCQSERCPHVLPADRRVFFNSCHSQLLEVIFRKAPKSDFVGCEPLVLAFNSATVCSSVYAAVAYNTRKKPIDAVLLDLQARDDVQVPGVLKVLACDKGVDGHAALLGDVEFCIRLAERAADWTMSILTIGPVRQLDHFDILAMEAIDWKALKKQAQEEAELKQIMAAYHKANNQTNTRKRSKGSHSTTKSGTEGSKKKRPNLRQQI